MFGGSKVRVDLLDPGTLTATLVTTDPHGLDCSEQTDTVTFNLIQRTATREITD